MNIELKTWNTRQVILRGEFISFKKAIEYAIDKNIPLDYLSLDNTDLSHGNFDGGSFSYARFNNCNFEGANLSETSCIKTQFKDCFFNNVSMMDGHFVGASFDGSIMKNCDALYADFRGAIISCLHFLKSDFRQTAHFGGACFMTKGNICALSHGPVFIRGLGMDLILLDQHVIVGSMVILRKEQIFDQRGHLSSIFAQIGLKPDQNLIEQLWRHIKPSYEKNQKVA